MASRAARVSRHWLGLGTRAGGSGRVLFERAAFRRLEEKTGPFENSAL